MHAPPPAGPHPSKSSGDPSSEGGVALRGEPSPAAPGTSRRTSGRTR